jgi:hypothetical protein
MKKNIFYPVVLVSFFSAVIIACHPEKASNQADPGLYNKNLQEFSVAKHDYQSFAPMIPFSGSSMKSEDFPIEVKMKKEFYRKSGLPDETNLYEWKQNNKIEKAISLFKKYNEDNSLSKDIVFFRQYGSWIILTKLELLSENSPAALEAIFYFTDILAKSNYQGFQLLHYSLNYLHENNFSESKIKSLGKFIIDYANGIKTKGPNISSDSSIQLQYVSGRRLDSREEQFIRNYFNQQYSHNNSSIAKIEELITNLN